MRRRRNSAPEATYLLAKDGVFLLYSPAATRADTSACSGPEAVRRRVDRLDQWGAGAGGTHTLSTRTKLLTFFMIVSMWV